MIRRIWDFLFPYVPAQLLRMRSEHYDRVLVFARELISDRRRWTTGVSARRADGYECHPSNEEAACFCVNGAIDACASTPEAAELARRVLADAVSPSKVVMPNTYSYAFMICAGLNDKHGHRATLAALDKAIRS